MADGAAELNPAVVPGAQYLAVSDQRCADGNAALRQTGPGLGLGDVQELRSVMSAVIAAV